MATNPTLSIPRDDGEGFGRVAGAVRFTNGAIAVGDASDRVIRLFTHRGAEYATVGREGSGPGEFRLISSVLRCAPDTLHVFDAFQSRVTAISATGTVAGVTPIYAGGTKPAYGLACNGAGSFLVLGWPRLPGEMPPGPYRESFTIHVADLAGKHIAAIGEYLGDERYRLPRGDGPRIFGRQSVVIGSGDRIFIGEGVSYSIIVTGPKGEVLDTILKPTAESPVSRADVEQYVADHLAQVRDAGYREAQRRGFREYDFPRTFPPYSGLLLDPRGNLWVRDFRPPTRPQETWSVFSPAGRLLQEVAMPQSLEALQVGEDFVLGRFTDSDGIHHVRIHRLQRP